MALVTKLERQDLADAIDGLLTQSRLEQVPRTPAAEKRLLEQTCRPLYASLVSSLKQRPAVAKLRSGSDPAAAALREAARCGPRAFGRALAEAWIELRDDPRNLGLASGSISTSDELSSAFVRSLKGCMTTLEACRIQGLVRHIVWAVQEESSGAAAAVKAFFATVGLEVKAEEKRQEEEAKARAQRTPDVEEPRWPRDVLEEAFEAEAAGSSWLSTKPAEYAWNIERLKGLQQKSERLALRASRAAQLAEGASQEAASSVGLAGEQLFSYLQGRKEQRAAEAEAVAAKLAEKEALRRAAAEAALEEEREQQQRRRREDEGQQQRLLLQLEKQRQQLAERMAQQQQQQQQQHQQPERLSPNGSNSASPAAAGGLTGESILKLPMASVMSPPRPDFQIKTKTETEKIGAGVGQDRGRVDYSSDGSTSSGGHGGSGSTPKTSLRQAPTVALAAIEENSVANPNSSGQESAQLGKKGPKRSVSFRRSISIEEVPGRPVEDATPTDASPSLIGSAAWTAARAVGVMAWAGLQMREGGQDDPDKKAEGSPLLVNGPDFIDAAETQVQRARQRREQRRAKGSSPTQSPTQSPGDSPLGNSTT